MGQVGTRGMRLEKSYAYEILFKQGPEGNYWLICEVARFRRPRVLRILRKVPHMYWSKLVTGS